MTESVTASDSHAALAAELAACRELRRGAVEGIREARRLLERHMLEGLKGCSLQDIDKVLATAIFHGGEKP